MDTQSHWFTATRPCFKSQGYANGAKITVEAGLRHLRGNARPYFSLTGTITEPRRGEVAGGQLHPDVLAHWPELAPVAALHLSDDRGEPTHAAANGLYHLGIGHYSQLNLAHAARHFRISESEAQELRDRIMSGSGHDAERYAAELEAMRPRWLAEAQAAVALLDRLRSTSTAE